MKKLFYDMVIVGGGAAGFFAAIQANALDSTRRILIIERSKEVLQKVKISGGGRCNVTHACFTPKELVTFYPRGAKELLGPFHQFAPGDMMHWLDQNGVPTKIEEDNRVFPISDSSQSIIDCFLRATRKKNIDLVIQKRLDSLKPPAEEGKLWQLICGEETIECKKVLIATGSTPKVWQLLENLGHEIVPPVPSLFTFPCKDKRIKGLMGLSVSNAAISVNGTKLAANGPLLITHWGFSGPAVLKLSAWGARELHQRNYDYSVTINWVYPKQVAEVSDLFATLKQQFGKQKVYNQTQFELPKRLWNSFVIAAGISENSKWADLNKNQLNALITNLCEGNYAVIGKSTFKEEFVTAGGVALHEVNFKTFESKLFPGLHFAGEVLNIDAITGGFNFQAAWTGAYIAAQAMVND